MATYLGFLRAINLGARRRFAKGAIVAAVEAAGGTDVATYINTGNIRFDLPELPREEIELLLEKSFDRAAGFDVPTIVYTPAEFRAIAATADRLGHAGGHYVSLLKAEPTPAQVEALTGWTTGEERAVVEGRAAHLLLGENYHTARLTGAIVERLLGLATNRNVTVVRTLSRAWC